MAYLTGGTKDLCSLKLVKAHRYVHQNNNKIVKIQAQYYIKNHAKTSKSFTNECVLQMSVFF